ncbi:MAG: 3-deoxy-D-manno-octulosonic acid transferase [Robiginitomaculum sp.]|nr:MAG: 3-deoxy-D-manno-octulosonic acid transferase [Robiginitomaculum sp.]
MKAPFSLGLYVFISKLFGWIYRPALMIRKWQGKEDASRIKERFGHSEVQRPNGQLIWIHGASVGESSLGLALAHQIALQRPDISFLFTSGTISSAKMIAARLGENQIHQFLPVDTPGSIYRFLDHWQPNLAILLESEIWPNLILRTAERNIPLALVNARMNERSRGNWSKKMKSAQILFGQFDWISAADQATADFLSQVTGQVPSLPGNLKMLPVPVGPPPAWLDELSQSLAGRPVWLGASTHEGEDKILMQAHAPVLQEHKDALLIIAPRHPERAKSIARLAGGRNLTHSTWSKTGHANASVLIADTIGDMQSWLELADIVFVGGSLGNGKGHNPLEAIRAKIPIISGSQVVSFAEIYADLEQVGAVQLLNTAPKIASAVLTRLTNSGITPAQVQAANGWLKQAENEIAGGVVGPLLSLLQGGPNAAP